MAKKTIQNQKGSTGATKKDVERLTGAMKENIEWLARVMKESIEESEKRFHKEVRESEERLRKEIRTSEENLGYRIAKVASDGYRRLDIVEPKITDHERRIKKLERREPVEV